MRKPLLCVVLLGAVVALSVPAAASARGAARPKQYVVLYEKGVSAKSARAAIRAAGGRIVHENRAVGLATVTARSSRFVARARAHRAIAGAAANRVIGREPGAGRDKPPWRDVESEGDGRGSGDRPAPTSDNLSGLQWDMQLIGATPSGSYARQQGSHAVRVGIMDTGIDGNHPDIAPNFDRALSRNFTVDNPLPGIDDGPCEYAGCVDPVDEDDDGHGTHVAGTVGAALNGIGVAGVAPQVDLVNIRAGQDSGFFLLTPFVDALTYAAEAGIDVVNMSFFIDPWLFNCRTNPADSPDEQAEQAAIIDMAQRTVDFARAHGVTLIAAEGNEATDLGNPTVDTTSPDFPPDAAKQRQVDNGCLTEPTEAEGVIAVSSVGPVNPAASPFPRKAFYSNYGVEQTDVAAPGGDSREFFGTQQFNAAQNRVLNAYPLNVAQACNEVDTNDVPTGETTCTPTGQPAPRAVPLVRDCANGRCALYQWIQGTSMAAPHAVGVAALIVAERGHPDRANGGLTMDPSDVGRILRSTATDTPCPAQEPFVYPDPASRAAGLQATCVGSPDFNGFYGDGIVNALAAVR